MTKALLLTHHQVVTQCLVVNSLNLFIPSCFKRQTSSVIIPCSNAELKPTGQNYCAEPSPFPRLCTDTTAEELS